MKRERKELETKRPWGLEQKEVLKVFEEVERFPRGSGLEDKAQISTPGSLQTLWALGECLLWLR